MLLNATELQSPAWHKIKKHFEERLEVHRLKNEGNLDEVATAKLRGRIAEARAVLALDQPDVAGLSDKV